MTDRVLSLVARIRAGDAGAVARGISLVENDRPHAEAILSALHPAVGAGRRIGITGPPGAGKSTLVDQLIRAYRAAGERVAVVAVDPTSPFTGGALLGDRLRMDRWVEDDDVYVRSMATRGSIGGVALATGEACDVLDAAGFTRILIETVGVGQSELDVATLVDTTLLVLVPEAGDGIQTLKSGILEIADCFVVNKADRPGAEELQRELRTMVELSRRPSGASGEGAWEPPVGLAVASTGEGVEHVVEGLNRHWTWMDAAGVLPERRERRLVSQARRVVRRAVEDWAWKQVEGTGIVDRERPALLAGRRTPYDVAAEVVSALQAKERASDGA